MPTYPSNLIQSGQGAPSIIPGTSKPVVGQVVVPAGITIALNDNFPLFVLSSGGGAHIADLWIGSAALDGGGTLLMQLSDTATPPNVIVAPLGPPFRAGTPVVTNANAAANRLGLGVTYTSPTTIQLLATAAAGAAIPAGGAIINFVFQVTSD